jgi:hypothetical protein
MTGEMEQRANMQSEGRKKTRRMQLGLVLLVAGLSLGGSYLLFFWAQGANGWGTTNNGVFVDPPRALADLDIRDESDARVLGSGTWSLWVLTGSSCDQQCQQALFQLRQLHILLDRDAGRVRRALVMASENHAQGLRASYPELAFLSGALDELAPGIYIVDPIGNLVFWYPLIDAGAPVLDDLKHLLKVSQIG